jgi:predicted KAP-like P-loop ATPase
LKAAREEATLVVEEASETIKDEEKSPTREIDELRKDFGEVLAEVERTLVVFIDNLDRCLPDAAIGTLEAMRLFLFMHRTAFVVAADEEMVRRSVAKHFAGLDPAHVRDYLDKVIQVPLRVPQVGAEDLRAYMYSLFVASDAPSHLAKVQATLLVALQNSWKGQSFTKEEIAKQCGEAPTLLDHLAIADRLAPIFAKAPEIRGNPRIVKRLLNAIMLRSQLASSRKMTINLATLAKLAVFERCTGEQATVALYRTAMAGDERALQWVLKPNEPLGDLPADWNHYKDFIEEWRQMEPPIDSIEELKGAAFLNRDALAPAPARPGASAAAEKAFQALMIVDSVNSKAGREAVADLAPADRSAVMTRLIEEMRGEDWTESVPGVHGALILAKSSPEAFAQLKSFIETLPNDAVNKGALFLFKKVGLLS